MFLLALGVLVWSLVHLSSSALPGVRATLIRRIGDQPYRGAYSLLIIFSLVLIVVGWRSSPAHAVLQTQAWGYPVMLALSALSLILFIAANVPGNIRRLLRHPMLIGVALWSLAHLLVNGESRSLLLFGAMGTWALLEILIINRRAGPRESTAAVSPLRDVVNVVIGLLVFGLLGWLHPYFTGLPALRF